MRKRTAVVGRLEMDVRSACIDGIGNQAVDRADHRRIAHHVLQSLEIALVDFVLDFGVGFGAVEPVDRDIDIAAPCDAPLDPATSGKSNALDRVAVQRIGHGDHHGRAFDSQRHRTAITQEGGGYFRHGGAVRREACRIDQRQAERPGERTGERIFRDQTEPRDDLVQRLARLAFNEPRPCERFLGHVSLAPQDRHEAIGGMAGKFRESPRV